MMDTDVGTREEALLTAFSQVYLAQKEETRPYLQAAYVESVGSEPLTMHMVRSLPEPSK